MSYLCLHGLHNCSHQTLNVRELFSRLTAILTMLEAILQAPFSEVLNAIEPGIGFPWGFSYCVTYQSSIENDSRSDLRLLKTG